MQNNVFVGNLAKMPTSENHNGVVVTRFILLSNEYAGKDKETNEVKQRVVSLPFTAFGAKGDAIAKNAMVGDQLIITYRIENNNYGDAENITYSYNFIMENFEFGAAGKKKKETYTSSQ